MNDEQIEKLTKWNQEMAEAGLVPIPALAIQIEMIDKGMAFDITFRDADNRWQDYIDLEQEDPDFEPRDYDPELDGEIFTPQPRTQPDDTEPLISNYRTKETNRPFEINEEPLFSQTEPYEDLLE